MIATLYFRCKAVWITRIRGRRKVSSLEERNENEALWGIFLWVTRGCRWESKTKVAFVSLCDLWVQTEGRHLPGLLLLQTIIRKKKE